MKGSRNNSFFVKFCGLLNHFFGCHQLNFGDEILDNLCEKCWYNTYDDDSEEYFCDLQLDEDEYVRLLQDKK